MRRAWRFVDYAAGGLGAATQAHDGLPYFQDPNILGDRLSDVCLSHRQIPRSLESGRTLLPQFLDYEYHNRFVAEFMTKVDGAAMYNGVEARSPLLDQKIWEFAASLPFELRLRRGELKAVLRAIVRKNIGPDVASRRKQGFTVPIERWLTKAWKPQLDAIAEHSVLEQDGWIRPGTLRTAVHQATARQYAPRQLWSLLVLEHWARKNVKRPVAAY
jgi:asparagine synthase (glutamine-hydrolysing)